MDNNLSTILAGILLIVVLFTLYFLPSIIGRKKRNALSIFLLNFFLGATGIGWIVALIWATKKDSSPAFVYVQADKSVELTKAIKNEIIVNDIDGSFKKQTQSKRKGIDPFHLFIILLLCFFIAFIGYTIYQSKNRAQSDNATNNVDTLNRIKSTPKISTDKIKPTSIDFNVSSVLNLTNPEQLYSRFSKKNILKKKFYDRENNYLGYKYVLFPKTMNEMDVDFLNNAPAITITKKSKWILPFGLYVGMPLSKLLAINKEEIDFSGFEWDYDGLITRWNGGKLENKGISIFLSANSNSDKYTSFMGDGTFNTTQDGVSDLKLMINEIRIEKQKK